MITIKLVDARRGLSQKCRELFSDRRIADQIYEYLCDGIEECDYAEPERPKGKWIYEEDGIIHGHCSCCGFNAIYQETDVFNYDYCPNCGARLKEGEEE